MKSPQDTVPFHPYYTVKDAFYLVLFAILFAGFVFYAPNFFGNPDNYQQANPLVTPPDIVPEWYLLPFYAMLRSIPNKLMGVIVMGGAIVTLFFIPWLDTSRVRSCRFRPLMKQFSGPLRWPACCWAIAAPRGVDAAVAGVPLVWVARIAGFYYFAFFWLIMPIVGLIETPKKLPASIGAIRARRYRRGPCRVRTNMRLTTVSLGTVLALGLLASTSAMALDTTRLAPKDVSLLL